MEDSKIIDKLKNLIKEGEELKDKLKGDPMSSFQNHITVMHNREHYQNAEKWKISTINILNLRFGSTNYYLKQFENAINTKYKFGGLYCKENVGKALGVLEAVREAIEEGLTEDLFYKREVDLFTNLLEQAYEFFRKGFDLAATIYGRIVLETVVKEFGNKHEIREKDFEQTIICLRKANLIIQPLEQSLRANYALGSLATHNNEDFKKVSKADIKRFLDFIKEKVLTL